MSTFIVASKLDTETISLEISFLSRMRLGEFLSTQTTTITVLSGADASPLPVVLSTVIGLDMITLQVEGGVPGVIYKIDVAGRTTLSNVLVQEVKLAVLSSNPL